VAAIGLDADGGNAAERFVFRGQVEAAAEFKFAETHPRRIAIVERRDWRRADVDAFKLRAVADRRRQRI
jgi:hypothetical protein